MSTANTIPIHCTMKNKNEIFFYLSQQASVEFINHFCAHQRNFGQPLFFHGVVGFSILKNDIGSEVVRLNINEDHVFQFVFNTLNSLYRERCPFVPTHKLTSFKCGWLHSSIGSNKSIAPGMRRLWLKSDSFFRLTPTAQPLDS